jgi:hypothetical protein
MWDNLSDSILLIRLLILLSISLGGSVAQTLAQTGDKNRNRIMSSIKLTPGQVCDRGGFLARSHFEFDQAKHPIPLFHQS